MQGVLIALLLLSGCAAWKQKDFENELNKPIKEVAMKVPTTSEDKEILEKFEVSVLDESKVDSPKPLPKAVAKKVVVVQKQATQDGGPKVILKNVVKPPTIIENPLPEDYPEELIAINEMAKGVWALYQSNHFVNEKVYLDIHYLGMTVGKIMVLNKGRKMLDGKEVWHFHARFKSAPFYSRIYELDDTVDTYVTTDQFLSTRYSLIQRESKQDIDDLQLHDRDKLKTFWFYHQKRSDGKKKDKKEEAYLPYFSVDPFSVLFLYQGLPLKTGDVYEIPIVNKTKILMLKSKVEGRENLTTEKGTRNAIRVRATTKYSGDTLKSGDLTFWFSDDNRRTLLKASAKIPIGSVTADIVDN